MAAICAVLPPSVGSASNHRDPYEAVIRVFDRTSGLEKPRDLSEWRPWVQIDNRMSGVPVRCLRTETSYGAILNDRLTSIPIGRNAEIALKNSACSGRRR